MLPDAVHQRSFVGDVDALRLNGEPLGLWNAENAARVSGATARARADGDETSEHGVISLNGRGYTQVGGAKIKSTRPRAPGEKK